MSLRWCESPGNAARIAALSADQAPTAIIGCPHMTSPIDVSTSPGSQAQLERRVACPGRTNASPKHL